MNRRSVIPAAACLVAAVLALGALSTGRTSADDGPAVPDPSPLAVLFPDAVRAPAPAWAKPGVRLVYFGASASIPGERTQIVLDPNGKWVNKITGQGLGEQSVSGASGAGYTTFQIGHVDPAAVAVSASLYVFDPATRQSMYSVEGGFVTTPGCAADLWVNPDVLRKVQPVNANGVRILRMPYTVNQHTYDAIRIETVTSKGTTAYVFDLETGLLVFHGSNAQGAGVLTPPIGDSGWALPGKGSTQIVTGWLVEVQEVKVPWAGAAVPPWVGRFRELGYGGAQSTVVPTAGQVDRPMTAAVAPRARREGWVRTAWQVTVQSPAGLPPEHAVQEGACGEASVGGLWIAPEAMAGLQRGQVIDRNRVIGTVLSVSDVGPRGATITETGPLHRRDWSYDARSGMLVGIQIVQQVGLGQVTHRVSLTGQR